MSVSTDTQYDQHIADVSREMQNVYDEAKAFQHFAENEHEAGVTAMIETVSGQIEGVIAGISIFAEDHYDLFGTPAAVKALYVGLTDDWQEHGFQSFSSEASHVEALKNYVSGAVELIRQNDFFAATDDVVKALQWDFEAISKFMDSNH